MNHVNLVSEFLQVRRHFRSERSVSLHVFVPEFRILINFAISYRPARRTGQLCSPGL